MVCQRGIDSAKKRYGKWSAYASGYAVQVCDGKKPDINGKTYKSRGSPKRSPQRSSKRSPQRSKSGMTRWFDEKWVQADTKAPCGRSGSKKYCRPTKIVDRSKTPVTLGELKRTKKGREILAENIKRKNKGQRPICVRISDFRK